MCVSQCVGMSDAAARVLQVQVHWVLCRPSSRVKNHPCTRQQALDTKVGHETASSTMKSNPHHTYALQKRKQGVFRVEQVPNEAIVGSDSCLTVPRGVQNPRLPDQRQRQHAVRAQNQRHSKRSRLLQGKHCCQHVVAQQQPRACAYSVLCTSCLAGGTSRRTEECYVSHAQACSKGLNATLDVALHVWQVLGDGNDHRKQRHKARDEAVGWRPRVTHCQHTEMVLYMVFM